MMKNDFGNKRLLEQLRHEIVKRCTARQLLNKQLYDIGELTDKWKQSAPQYMADVVPEFNAYPMVAIAWACYYGMGAAALWDRDWDGIKDCPDLYVAIRDKRGFDAMDDYVAEELLGLHAGSPVRREADEAAKLTATVQECAETALSLLQHSGAEAGTKDAFLLFAKIAGEFFQLGVSIELYRQGYRYEKMALNG